KNGQPKRDITTIIHILNDLLCAQYKNYNSAASSNPSASGRKAETPATASKQAPSSSENPSDTAS
ncbi:Putative LOC100646570, partial [Caligus rogercresseyi]